MSDNRLIDVKELLELCGINSPQTLLQWLKRNIAKINTDGEHVEKVGKSWLFDSVAVERIIELRSVKSTVGIVTTTNAKTNALEGEIEQLNQSLISAQSVIAQKQDTIIELKNRLFENMEKLADIKALERENELLRAQLEELKQDKRELLALVTLASKKKKKKK